MLLLLLFMPRQDVPVLIIYQRLKAIYLLQYRCPCTVNCVENIFFLHSFGLLQEPHITVVQGEAIELLPPTRSKKIYGHLIKIK